MDKKPFKALDLSNGDHVNERPISGQSTGKVKNGVAPPKPDVSDISVAARVQNSAASLMNDMLSNTAAGASSAPSALASLALSDKSSSFGGRASQQSAALVERSTNPAVSHGQVARTAEGFRETRQTDDSEFALFSNGPADVFKQDMSGSTEAASREPFSPAAQLERRELEDLQYDKAVVKGKGKARAGDVGIFESMDGQDVVDLLNGTESLEAEVPNYIGMHSEPSAEELFDQPLSAGDTTVMSRLLAGLPAPPTYKTLGRESMNNFLPNLEVLHRPVDHLDMSHQGTFSTDTERRKWMMQWMEEWDSVLRRYTDEVWGTEAIANVQEAREEIAEMKTDKDRLDDVRALRRLKLILGHIRIPGAG